MSGINCKRRLPSSTGPFLSTSCVFLCHVMPWCQWWGEEKLVNGVQLHGAVDELEALSRSSSSFWVLCPSCLVKNKSYIGCTLCFIPVLVWKCCVWDFWFDIICWSLWSKSSTPVSCLPLCVYIKPCSCCDTVLPPSLSCLSYLKHKFWQISTWQPGTCSCGVFFFFFFGHDGFSCSAVSYYATVLLLLFLLFTVFVTEVPIIYASTIFCLCKSGYKFWQKLGCLYCLCITLSIM